MDTAIKDFLEERKEGWLKKKLKADISETEETAIYEEAEDKFSLPSWLPDAAKRAGWLSLVSHPSKFSHPGAKTSMIIADAMQANDGLVRTGNVSAEQDVLGNAAALDVFKFLSLVLEDGCTILEHLQQKTGYIQEQLSISTATFEELSTGFLSIQKQDTKQITHGKVKQVYFPVGDDYHLLSILTPSGIMYELTDRIKKLRFSEETKIARDAKRKKEFHPHGFDELFDITVIGYGGTKPQNISVLNSQNGGKVYLLPSLPPQLQKRNVRLPRNNFFTEVLWHKHYQETFHAFHRLLAADINNINIRRGRDNRILFILDQVVKKVWDIRGQDTNWSHRETYKNLPKYQKIWLDDHYRDERESEDGWLKEVVTEFARWFIRAYKKNIGDPAKLLGDDEMQHIKHLIQENEEALR